MLKAAIGELRTRDDHVAFLRRHVIDAWFPRSIDRQHGGFLCDFDARWRECGPQNKLMEFQSRQTLTAAELCIAFPDESLLREAMLHGFAFLAGPMWDREYGGWFMETDRAGTPLRPQMKHTHGMAYAIEACFAVHAVTGDPRALDLGVAGFEWIDRHAHDAAFGGYFGPLHRDGRVMRASDTTASTDMIATPFGLKDMNVNSDFYEGFAYAAAVGGAPPTMIERLDELRDIILRRFAVEGGRPWFYFTPDWTPVPPLWRPATAVQTACRMIEDRSGPDVEGRERAAKALFHFGFSRGWSTSPPGLRLFANADHPDAPPPAGDLQWWSQFELLRAADYVAALDPQDGEARRIGDLARRFIDTQVVNHAHGGTYNSPLCAIPWRSRLLHGRAWRKGTMVGGEWKDANHEARTVLRLAGLALGTPAAGIASIPVLAPRTAAAAPG